MMFDSSTVNSSPKKRGKKSVESKRVHLNKKYIPMEFKKNKENHNLTMESMFSKSYGPSKNKFGANYKAALQELKVQ